MKIILANETELNPIIVTGGRRFVSGVMRDTLDFVFSADTTIEEIDSIFTAENCENIKIYDIETNEEFIHKGYTIRADLLRKPVVVTPATEEAEAVTEERIIVSMSERTYTENEVVTLQGIINALLGEDE